MTIYLKQSTASQEIPLGYFVDSTDGDTAETGLTIANTDIQVWKTGATTLANKNSGGATHISGGVYYAVLDATDTDTLGPLVIFVHVSGALTVRLECCVLAANVYDSLIGASDNLQVDILQVSGDSTAADNAESFFDGTGYAGTNNVIPTVTTVNGLAANVITAAAINADAVTEIQSGLSTLDAAGIRSAVGMASANLDTQLAALPTAEENTQSVWDFVPGESIEGSTADMLTIQVTNIDTLYAAVLELPTADANADAVWDEATSGHTTSGTTGAALIAAGSAGDPWSTSLPGAYGAGTAGHIVGNRLDAAVSSRASASDLATVDGIVDAILEDTGTTLPSTLAGLATAANLATVDTIVDSIVEDTGTTIPAQISALNNLSSAQVQTAAAAALTAYDPPTNAEMEARTLAAAAYFDPAADTVANVTTVGTVTNPVTAGTVSDKTGYALSSAGVSAVQSGLATGSDLTTVGNNVSAVLEDTGTTIPATLTTLATSSALATVDGIADSILEDTGTTIPATLSGLATSAEIAALNDLDAAGVRAAIGMASANLDTQIGTLATSAEITALNDLSAAEVNAEVVDVIRTDLIPDSIPADGAYPTISQAVYMLLQYMHEKDVDGTTVTIKKPDGTTTLMTLTLDDGTNPTSITRAT